jgi:hypothetical protein
MTDKPERYSEVDSRPVPDPTVLTTQQLLREIFSVREIYDTRLEGMDKAVTLLQATLNKSPSTAEMYAKHEQMFVNIANQFKERDTRTDQNKIDNKVNVDAALQAAKEAVGENNKSSAQAIAKSEAATTKQIDAIGALIISGQKSLDDKITSGQKASDDKIDDIKTRLTSIESNKLGASESKQSAVSTWVIVFGAFGMMFGLIGSALAIAAFLKH